MPRREALSFAGIRPPKLVLRLRVGQPDYRLMHMHMQTVLYDTTPRHSIEPSEPKIYLGNFDLTTYVSIYLQ